MSLLGLIILIVILAAVLPTWPYSRGWGYRPTSIVGLILLILLIVLLVRGTGGGSVVI